MSTLFIRVQEPATTQNDEQTSSLSDPEALTALDALDEITAYSLTAAWLISEASGEVRAEGVADLRGLSELVDPDSDWIQNPANVVLLVPAGLVLNINCDVPGRNQAQVRRALPFAVEEFVATDIEMMHVAAGEIARGGNIRSQVVERKLLEDWLAALRSVGIRPGYTFSDAELLPASATRSTLLFDGDEVLMKSRVSAACVDAENLEFVLTTFIEDSGTETSIESLNGEIDALTLAQLPPEIEIEKTSLESGQSVLGYLASRWRNGNPLTSGAINLLQGDYSVRMSASGGSSKWRAVGVLAAAWFLIALVALAVKGFYSDSEAQRLKANSQALYKDIYPATQRIPPNLKRDVQFRMGGSGTTGGQFVPLVGQLAEHLTPEVKVRSFNFQGSRDELSTELIVGKLAAVDDLKVQLDGNGMSVEISSIEEQSDGVHARLRLRSNNAQ